MFKAGFSGYSVGSDNGKFDFLPDDMAGDVVPLRPAFGVVTAASGVNVTVKLNLGLGGDWSAVYPATLGGVYQIGMTVLVLFLSENPRNGVVVGPVDVQDLVALVGHTHSQYSPTSHDHNGVYANDNHLHSGVYASYGHTHSQYASDTHYHSIYALDNHAHGQYAQDNHLHSGVYATSGHTHSQYATDTHTHSGVYATSGHTHSNYATDTHAHTGYAATSHTHSGYLALSDLIVTSVGAADAGKGVKLDNTGKIDATVLDDGDIDHTLIGNRGANTHAQIDSHIASTSNPHATTAAQVGAALASHAHSNYALTTHTHTTGGASATYDQVSTKRLVVNDAIGTPVFTVYNNSGEPAIDMVGGDLLLGDVTGGYFGAAVSILNPSNGGAMVQISRKILVANETTVPTSNPVGGGYLYAQAGAGKWRGSSGTITTIGAAEPHCPVCGRDFVTEWENPRYGHLIVCLWCLTEELGQRPWIVKQK